MGKGYVGASKFVNGVDTIYATKNIWEGSTPFQPEPGVSITQAVSFLRQDGYDVDGVQQSGGLYLPYMQVRQPTAIYPSQFYGGTEQKITRRASDWLGTLVLVLLFAAVAIGIGYGLWWAVVTSAAIRGVVL